MTQSIPNWLKKRASLTPDRTALIFENQSYTFNEIFNRASNVAGQLKVTGLKKGAKTAVLLSNHADTVLILYGLQMLGVTAVILNNRLTADELIWQVEDSGTAILITENAFSDKTKIIKETLDQKVIDKEELFLLTKEKAELQDEYDLNDITTIMYTSGTTGNPKGVQQSYGNHWWSANASALNIGLREDDCWLCVVPIFHISGYSILMRSLIYGMTVVLHKRFNEKLVLEEIKTYRVTIMSVVSTILLRINEELGNDRLPGHFRCMLLGGGPAPLSLLEDCKQKEIPVYQSYGMTETASQFATLAPEYSLKKLGSAGKPLFPNQIKNIGESGAELPCMMEGEIVVKGPNVTPGYLNRELDTIEKIRSGWLFTGDVGYLDDEGFLYVLDRRSDLIISGGENIYPAEIEGILLSHPKVSDAGIIGMEDPQWGEIPIAFVVRGGSEEVTERELIDFCEGKLAKYKIPKNIHFVNELPRNASKKLLRRKLRESLERGDG